MWDVRAVISLLALQGLVASCASEAAQEECDLKWFVENVECPAGSAPQFRVAGSDGGSLGVSPDTVEGTFVTEAECEYACVWGPGGGDTGAR